MYVYDTRDRRRNCQAGLYSQVQKKLAKGQSAEKIADDLEEELSVIQEIIREKQE